MEKEASSENTHVRQKKLSLISFEAYPGGSFNPDWTGYTAAPATTGFPEGGWCLYSRGGGDCWNQRTQRVFAPEPNAYPKRLADGWWWVVDETSVSNGNVAGAPQVTPKPSASLQAIAREATAIINSKVLGITSWSQRSRLEYIQNVILAALTKAQAAQQDGIALIAAERQRQITVEGWTPEHDTEHVYGELAEAGAAYALLGKATDKTLIRTVREIQVNASRGIDGTYDFQLTEDDFNLWPWDDECWKPSDDPVRNLAKAGALIAAEIDRLLRKDSSVSDGGSEHAARVSVIIEHSGNGLLADEVRDFLTWKKEA